MIKIFNVFFIAISLHLAAGTMEFVAKKQTNVLFNVKDYGLTQMYFDIIGHRILLKVNPKLIDKNFDIKINNHEILRIEKNNKYQDLLICKTNLNNATKFSLYNEGCLQWERIFTHSSEVLLSPHISAAIFDKNMQVKEIFVVMEECINDNITAQLLLLDAKSGLTKEQISLPNLNIGIPRVISPNRKYIVCGSENINILCYNEKKKSFDKYDELDFKQYKNKKFWVKNIWLKNELAIITIDNGGRGAFVFEQKLIIYSLKHKKILFDHKFTQYDFVFNTPKVINDVCLSEDCKFMAIGISDYIYVYVLKNVLSMKLDCETSTEVVVKEL